MSFDFKKMTKFEHNVGDKEKQYRLYGGAAILAISVFMGEPFMLIIGLVLVATGYSGWCPAYSGLGKNTCVAVAEAAPAPKAAAPEKPASKAKSKAK
jgi:hypothetical protein